MKCDQSARPHQSRVHGKILADALVRVVSVEEEEIERVTPQNSRNFVVRAVAVRVLAKQKHLLLFAGESLEGTNLIFFPGIVSLPRRKINAQEHGIRLGRCSGARSSELLEVGSAGGTSATNADIATKSADRLPAVGSVVHST